MNQRQRSDAPTPSAPPTPDGHRPIVCATGLTIADRSGAVILSGVDLTVHAGQSVAILGPSGAGKTTLALALLGRLRPGLQHRAGSVLVAGLDVLHADRRSLARLRSSTIHYVPQDPLAALTPTARVRTLLAEAIGPVPDRAGRTRDLLTRIRLPADADFLRRRPHQLSGGQRQRLLLALALAGPPAAIVLDEPTAGQDPATRNAIVDEIIRLRDEIDLALVTITHDSTVAARLGDRIVHLDHGTLVPRPRPPDPECPPVDPANATPPVAPPSERSPVILATGLTASHRDTTVLHGIDLALRPGETLAVIGESGAGKTTLARVLAGLHPPASGTLHTAPSKTSHIHRRRTVPTVGFIYQDPHTSLNPARTVRAIVADATGLSRRHRLAVADRLLADVGLDPAHARRRPGQLSGGQQQRVAIARALATAAPVLVCDEPTSALDTATRDAICDLLRTLSRERGLAILLVSHDPEVVRRTATRVLVLHHGRAVETGDIDEILDHPSHPATRDLLHGGQRGLPHDTRPAPAAAVTTRRGG